MAGGPLASVLEALLSEAKTQRQNPIEAFAAELDRKHALARCVAADGDFECWHLVTDPPLLVGLRRFGSSFCVGAMVAVRGATPQAIADLRRSLRVPDNP